MIKQLLCVALLLMTAESVGWCESPCTATALSLKEAQSLVMVVPDAVAAKKMGGKLSAMEWKPAHMNSSFYYFMLLSTISAPTTPLGNGMLGYFSVNKVTGRVVNVAGEDTVGTQLGRLQVKLRARHCINEQLVAKEHDNEP